MAVVVARLKIAAGAPGTGRYRAAVSVTPDPERWLSDHGDGMYAFALLRLREPNLAEEAVQEALLAALTSHTTFDGRSSERTWLLGILRHKVLDLLRRRARPAEGAAAAPLEDSADAAARPEHAWEGDPSRWLQQAEFRRIFRECLDELPPDMARAFVLREVDGLSTDEICQVLGVTATNLWTMLHRARSRLRRLLDTRWFENRREDDRK